MILETANAVAIHQGEIFSNGKTTKYGALTKKKSGIVVRTPASQYM